MKILILSPSVYPTPGGLQRYTYNLTVSLAKANHRVHLLALERIDRRGTVKNLTYEFVDRWNTVGNNLFDKIRQKYHLGRKLYEVIRTFKPDEIICTWWDPWGYLAVLLGRFVRVPVICVGHGQEVIRLPERRFSRLAKKWLRRCVFSRSALVVAVSNFTKDRIVSLGVNSCRIKVIPNGLTSDYIERAIRIIESPGGNQNIDGHVILQVGRLVPRKGHKLVLQALAQIRNKLSKPVTYVIVGSGPNEGALERKALQLGVQDSTIFTGFIPDEDLHHYYRIADVVVMPSHNTNDPGDVEGFGIVYLEAYAHGKPVIGAWAGGVPDVIQHEETGLLVPPGDVHALAEALLQLIDNPEDARAMGERGKERLMSKWHWDKLREEFLLE